MIGTLNPKQYQDALKGTLNRVKYMENNGSPYFPVIKMLAESEEDTTVELKSCRFDDIGRWTEKKPGHFLEIRELDELMIMFMQFRGQLMKQVGSEN